MTARAGNVVPFVESDEAREARIARRMRQLFVEADRLAAEQRRVADALAILRKGWMEHHRLLAAPRLESIRAEIMGTPK